MKVIEVKERKSHLIESLLDLWERSVRATHDFLDEKMIGELKTFVPYAISGVPHLAVAYDGEVPIGFIGVDNKKIEMLFVDADQRGRGVGSALLDYAFKEFEADEVVVNENNHHAHEFYLLKGFKDVERKTKDEQGNPYPIIIMKR